MTHSDALQPSPRPRTLNEKVGRLLGLVVLVAVPLAILAVIAGYFLRSEERSYTGPAEIISSDHYRVCDLEVRFPDGSTHSYSLRTGPAFNRYSTRSASKECAAYTPGSTIQIEGGKVGPPAQ